uniref:Uncharacterized protein n=1 Tax=Anopheles culicifacies TaxID=139723 RepID=A0A182MLN8_9DIPT
MSASGTSTVSSMSTGTPSATPTIEQQQEWRLEMKLSCRFGNKLYKTFVDEFDYVRDLLGLIRFEIPKWVFVVSEFEDEISSYECNRAARAAQQAAVAAVSTDQEFLVRSSLTGEKGSKHEKFIEPEVRDRIKKDNHNCIAPNDSGVLRLTPEYFDRLQLLRLTPEYFDRLRSTLDYQFGSTAGMGFEPRSCLFEDRHRSKTS